MALVYDDSPNYYLCFHKALYGFLGIWLFVSSRCCVHSCYLRRRDDQRCGNVISVSHAHPKPLAWFLSYRATPRPLSDMLSMSFSGAFASPPKEVKLMMTNFKELLPPWSTTKFWGFECSPENHLGCGCLSTRKLDADSGDVFDVPSDEPTYFRCVCHLMRPFIPKG